jgi:hypothetical protein
MPGTHAGDQVGSARIACACQWQSIVGDVAGRQVDSVGVAELANGHFGTASAARLRSRRHGQPSDNRISASPAEVIRACSSPAPFEKSTFDSPKKMPRQTARGKGSHVGLAPGTERGCRTTIRES